MDLADKNAQHLLEEFKLAALEADERAVDPVYELQRELGLPRLPRSLICFDISHAQGTDVVARVEQLAIFLQAEAVPQIPAWCPVEVRGFIEWTAANLQAWAVACRVALN